MAQSTAVSTHYQGKAGAAYHHYYEKLAPANGEVAARKFQQFVSPTDTVVDFGCGAGFTLARLQAGSAIGVEVNEESRRVAESIGIQTVASADLLPEQSADVVISNHCLEHTLSPLIAWSTPSVRLRSYRGCFGCSSRADCSCSTCPSMIGACAASAVSTPTSTTTCTPGLHCCWPIYCARQGLPIRIAVSNTEGCPAGRLYFCSVSFPPGLLSR